MTTKQKSDYRPTPNSLPSLVIGFFTNHPGEYLTLEDVAEKFSHKVVGLRKTLQPAVDAGLLTCTRDDLDNYIYRDGAGTTSTQEASTTGQGAEVKRITALGEAMLAKPNIKPVSNAAKRKTLDFEALVVEEGVPYLHSPNHGKSKWAGLFEKLTRKGQSLVVPGDCRGAVACAASKYNKKKQGTYKVGLADGGFARVWRTA
jgi:hypothetical protein